jgi:putative endonuclease
METENNPKKSKIVFVYIIKMANGKFYTGWTTDLERRFRQHQEGKGAKTTKAFKVSKIVASWSIEGSKSDALKVEAFIKKKCRNEKNKFVNKPEILEILYNQISVDPVIFIRIV